MHSEHSGFLDPLSFVEDLIYHVSPFPPYSSCLYSCIHIIQYFIPAISIFISHICCSFSLTAVVQISAPQTTATFCHLIYIHTLNENACLLAHFLLFFFYPSAMCLFLKFRMLSSTHSYPFQIFITFLTFLLLTHPLYKILLLH